MARIRTYRELRQLPTFMERFNYLSLKGYVGEATFGFDRWINQLFYTSREWRDVRQEVIIRDMGCDLGVPGYEIFDSLLIHHINPITAKDIENGEEWIVEPDYLITTSHRTHNAIHYGDENQLRQPMVARTPGDTKLW